ncbi:hypothetical protein [Piscirickettsia salmonis]|uniref:hypothetical protein n=1 Tax=Piscirickettsia salmonis TaxID=1238 RepID=UPI000ACF444C|nr:hypothetical protein [Piscirickettsia salmonis]
MKTKIYLHGRLGRICGPFFELNIHHAREALYALSTQLPEFKKSFKPVSGRFFESVNH